MARINRCAGIGCKMDGYMRSCDMDASVTEQLEASRVVHNYARGQNIFLQGTDSKGLYCVRSGQIFLWCQDAFGHKTGFRVVGPGELTGYRSLFGQDPHNATAEALTSSDVCFYPRGVILELVSSYPEFANHFFKTLARDRGPRDALFLRANHLRVRVRLIYLLLAFLGRSRKVAADGSVTFKLPVTRNDIASLLSTTPESVSRTIKQLEHDGIAQFKGRNVLVANVKKLYQETNLAHNH